LCIDVLLITAPGTQWCTPWELSGAIFIPLKVVE
jgi:hypothetical protein